MLGSGWQPELQVTSLEVSGHAGHKRTQLSEGFLRSVSIGRCHSGAKDLLCAGRESCTGRPMGTGDTP